MLKRIASITGILAVTLSLGGCFSFGGDDTAETPGTDTEGFGTYENSAFVIAVPQDWEIIESNDFTSDVPAETQVVFRNHIKNETFTANVNVVERSIQDASSSSDFGNLVMNRQSSGLVDFSEIKKDTVGVSIGGNSVETFFIEFEARKTTSDPVIKYFQTYAVKDNAGYIITGAVSQQENQTVSSLVENTVKSFQLK